METHLPNLSNRVTAFFLLFRFNMRQPTLPDGRRPTFSELEMAEKIESWSKPRLVASAIFHFRLPALVARAAGRGTLPSAGDYIGVAEQPRRTQRPTRNGDGRRSSVGKMDITLPILLNRLNQAGSPIAGEWPLP